MPADTKKEAPKTGTATKSTGAKTKPKNDQLAPGIRRHGKASWKRLTGRFHKFTKATKAGKPAKKITKKQPKVQAFNDKKKESRTIATKGRRMYPAEVAPRHLPTTHTLRPAKVRASITPGTVAILLVGRYKGQRAVVLKVLPSGLVLVSGPYKINGVPLRRVNPAYLIATSTRVDLAGVTVPAHIDDNYFRAARQQTQTDKSEKKTEKTVVVAADKKKVKKQIDSKRIADQKSVDTALLTNIKKVPQLADYISSRFTLRNGEYPHAMKF